MKTGGSPGGWAKTKKKWGGGGCPKREWGRVMKVRIYGKSLSQNEWWWVK